MSLFSRKTKTKKFIVNFILCLFKRKIFISFVASSSSSEEESEVSISEVDEEDGSSHESKS